MGRAGSGCASGTYASIAAPNAAVRAGTAARLASRFRCWRLGSTDRRSIDLTACTGEAEDCPEKRVAKLRASEPMTTAISTPCHKLTWAMENFEVGRLLLNVNPLLGGLYIIGLADKIID